MTLLKKCKGYFSRVDELKLKNFYTFKLNYSDPKSLECLFYNLTYGDSELSTKEVENAFSMIIAKSLDFLKMMIYQNEKDSLIIQMTPSKKITIKNISKIFENTTDEVLVEIYTKIQENTKVNDQFKIFVRKCLILPPVPIVPIPFFSFPDSSSSDHLVL